MIDILNQWPMWAQVAVGVAVGHFVSTWLTWLISIALADAFGERKAL